MNYRGRKKIWRWTGHQFFVPSGVDQSHLGDRHGLTASSRKREDAWGTSIPLEQSRFESRNGDIQIYIYIYIFKEPYVAPRLSLPGSSDAMALFCCGFMPLPSMTWTWRGLKSSQWSSNRSLIIYLSIDLSSLGSVLFVHLSSNLSYIYIYILYIYIYAYRSYEDIKEFSCYCRFLFQRGFWSWWSWWFCSSLGRPQGRWQCTDATAKRTGGLRPITG